MPAIDGNSTHNERTVAAHARPTNKLHKVMSVIAQIGKHLTLVQCFTLLRVSEQFHAENLVCTAG